MVTLIVLCSNQHHHSMMLKLVSLLIDPRIYFCIVRRIAFSRLVLTGFMDSFILGATRYPGTLKLRCEWALVVEMIE